MRFLLGLVLTPLFYLCFGLALLLFWPIQWLSLNIGGYKAHKKSVDVLNLLLTYCQAILLNRVSFTFSQPIPANTPIIFIANHQSLYDIPSLIYFLRAYHAKMISKIELTRGIPSISYNLKHGGGANINRKDARQSITELLSLGKRMRANNWSAVIFAEGTRARNGVLQPFKHAGVATLLKAAPGAVIVPIAISNSWRITMWGLYPLGTLLRLSWQVLTPIQTTGITAEEATKQAWQQITSVLNTHQ